MNDDVNDGGSHDSSSDTQLQPHIFSRIRNFNNLAINSIGSLFSAPPSSLGGPTDFDATNYDYNLWNYTDDLQMARTPNALEENKQVHAQHYHNVHNIRTLTATEVSTPTQTRSNSPLRSSRFKDVKRILTNFARSRQTDSYDQTHFGHSSDESQPLPLLSSMTPSSIVSASGSDHFATPPLTPDVIDDHILPSPSPSSCVQDILYDPYHPAGHHHAICSDHNQNTLSHSLEIKAGKKPERVVCYDALIEDAPGSYKARSPASVRSRDGATSDDRDEWYGLEYTLELSSRERRPSNTQSLSPGEHSKSHESWAAIHQGAIHPFFEDEDYYQWKNWHRYLDRKDERRKHKKALEFRAKSKDLAWCYADEFRTRDVMYWQKEEYGMNTRDVLERLKILAENRPDPYLPPMKHNLAWYLKRSRSVACLRELRSLARTNLDEDRQFAALESDNYP